MGSQSGQELTVRRNQVNAAEKKQYGRVEERETARAVDIRLTSTKDGE